jgi:hypothetical protein
MVLAFGETGVVVRVDPDFAEQDNLLPYKNVYGEGGTEEGLIQEKCVWHN